MRPTLVCGLCDFCRTGRDNLCRDRRLMGLNAAGGLARFVTAPAGNLVPLATDAVAEASVVEVLANAVHIIGLAHEARSIAIAGGGALGLLSLLLAAEAGISERLLTEPDEGRRSVAKHLGATATADPRRTSLAALVAERVDGGADVAVDAVGLGATRRDAIGAVRAGGRVVMLGLEEEFSEIDFADVVRREIEIKGSFAYTAEEFRRAAMFPRHAATLLPLVETESIEAGSEVFARLANREDTRVKVVLVPYPRGGSPRTRSTAGSRGPYLAVHPPSMRIVSPVIRTRPVKPGTRPRRQPRSARRYGVVRDALDHVRTELRVSQRVIGSRSGDGSRCHGVDRDVVPAPLDREALG